MDRRALKRRFSLRCGALSASVIALAGLPTFADAAGSMQPKPNTDFRELIIKGERPEIAACLAAAIEYARHNPGFTAIRWSSDESDRAVMWESETNGHLTRQIHMRAQVKTPESNAFFRHWQSMELYCEQPEDGIVRVSVKPASG